MMEIEYMCRHSPCPETFRTKEEEEKHYFKTHGLICKSCGYGTDSFEVLERHLKYVHDKPFLLVCKVCNESIEGVNEIQKHLEFTHGTNHWSLTLGLRELDRILEKIK